MGLELGLLKLKWEVPAQSRPSLLSYLNKHSWHYLWPWQLFILSSDWINPQKTRTSSGFWWPAGQPDADTQAGLVPYEHARGSIPLLTALEAILTGQRRRSTWHPSWGYRSGGFRTRVRSLPRNSPGFPPHREPHLSPSSCSHRKSWPVIW